MAWENCLIDGLTTGTIASGSTKFYQNFSYTNRNGVIPSDLSYTITKTQTQINSASSGSYLVGDVNAGIQIHDTKIYLRGNWNYQYWDSALTDRGGDDYCIFAGINEETQRGTIFGFARWSNERWAITDGSCFNSEGVYHILKAIQQIVYTWQSVAGVSGKGQTYSLSQIASASINNGEAVSGASASAFTSLTAQVSTMVTDDSEMSGADAGGVSGSGSNSGNQSTGYGFGQGESGTNLSGGGSGLYGGYKGGSSLSGGAGSGYIGNALVSNKKMVGFNVPTSSAEATKTESVSQASATPTPNVPKIGNGFAKIKFLYELPALLVKGIDPLVHTDTIGIRKLDLTIPNADLYNKFLSYDSETGRFTVLRSFYAFIKGSVETSTDGTIYLRSYGQTRVNGTAILSYDSDVTPHATASASTYRQMEVGDLIDEYVPRSDGFPKLGIEITIAVPDNS